MTAPTTFPAFDLPRAGGGRLRSDDLAGRPWVAYLARHTGCSICQARLRELVAREDEIRAAGAEIVVVFPTPLSHVEEWRERTPETAHLTALADEDADLYRRIGTTRASLLHLARRNATITIREMRRGNVPRLTRADMLRLGADAVVDADGTLSALHVCSHATDRMTPGAVLAALGRTAPAPAIA